MSKTHKFGRGAAQPAPVQSPPEALQPKERERVAQLIAANKSDLALDFAKDVHKRCRCADSEALLMDAYGARLTFLVERKLDREATSLLDLVRERYPASAGRLSEWNTLLAARRGDLRSLLAPLNDPSLPAEKQAVILVNIRQHVLDPGALAECGVLPPEHPLSLVAVALSRAFEAVTTGPVTEEALALPEVARSSPLAPWKMLVRAIAAYYRRDDATCEKYLAAVDAESAAARLTPAIRAMTRGPAQGETLNPAAAALVNQVGGDVALLRTVVKRLDAALDRGGQHSLVLQEIPHAITACRQVAPDLLERLKQHIAVRCMMAELRADKVAAAMDGPSLKNAYFWRLLARAQEEDKENPMAIGHACSAWEEFRKHAVSEGWFPAKGPEAGAVYLRMADQLRHLGPEILPRITRGFLRQFDGFAEYYRGQPPEIRSLAPDPRRVDLYFLSLPAVLDRACDADPCAENFQRWLREADEESLAAGDRVAERWSEALPKDIPPLLRLMQSAEKRNALQKAFKLMERAERIDGLNAEVRQARLRLLVAIAARHLRENKPKLAEKDVAHIEALPQARQGDRPAFVAALRGVCSLRLRGHEQFAASHRKVAQLLGAEVTARLLFLQLERWCGGYYSEAEGSPAPEAPLFAALGRVCAVAEDMGMPVMMIDGMVAQLMKELAKPNVSAEPRALLALGEVALRHDYFPVVYLISAAGLAQGAESQARFLFLRARALPPWEEDRRSQCLAAAGELARRVHDSELLKRIGAWRDEELEWLDAPEAARAELGTEEIAGLVKREIREPMPTEPPEFEDDGEEFGMPPELQEMTQKFGPEAVAQALAQILGGGGKKKRGRRPFGDRDPF